MNKPLVAVIGKPNVGKSTFFNRLAGRRISIVQDMPGVTRDRIYADVEWRGHVVSFVDTGGLDPQSDDVFLKLMRRQAEFAVETADVILFMTDAKTGMTVDDEEVANYLRKTQKPVVLAVNKVDNEMREDALYDFYALGLGEPYGVSAEHGLGIGDVLDAVYELLPPFSEEEDQDTLKIAVVGRPNVGKSSLVNKLLNQERSMVSDIPGTTRDAIDTSFTYQDKNYTLIDTAGIRRRARIEDKSVERYSVVRSFAALRRADVVFIILDATQGIAEQDVRIAGFVHEEGKPSVIIVNKWDLIEKDTYTMDTFRKTIKQEFAFMAYAPTLFISALTGHRVQKSLELAEFVHAQANKRIGTGILNEMIQEAQISTPAPSDKGRRLKIYYVTQASGRPPTFVFFTNDAKLMHFSYRRYLENYIRKTFDLAGTPIKTVIRERDEE
ncbi:MAG: ribosome biogenesis GTPase Der [Christensenellales bacterium]|jgi:GTP-binding protein